jgi:hypothetical protein
LLFFLHLHDHRQLLVETTLSARERSTQYSKF